MQLREQGVGDQLIFKALIASILLMCKDHEADIQTVIIGDLETLIAHLRRGDA